MHVHCLWTGNYIDDPCPLYLETCFERSCSLLQASLTTLPLNWHEGYRSLTRTLTDNPSFYHTFLLIRCYSLLKHSKVIIGRTYPVWHATNIKWGFWISLNSSSVRLSFNRGTVLASRRVHLLGFKTRQVALTLNDPKLGGGSRVTPSDHLISSGGGVWYPLVI